MFRMHLGRAAAVLAAACILSRAALASDPVPAEEYGRLPRFEAPALSPDGTRVAFLTSVRGQRCIGISDFAGKVAKPFCGAVGTEINWLRWKTNTRLLVSVHGVSEFQGMPIRYSTLFAADVDGSNMITLLRPRQGRMINFTLDAVVDFDLDDPAHVLLAVARIAPEFPDVVRVDINTGDESTVLSSRDQVVRWMGNGHGQVRIGFAIKDRKSTFLWRDSDTADFAEIPASDVLGRNFVPAAFGDQPGTIYVSSNAETGRTAFYLYDVKAGRVLDRYASRPDVDVQGLIFDQGRVVGYRYLDDQPEQVFTDPVREREQVSVQAALKGQHVEFLDRTADGSRVLLQTWTGSEPPVVQLLERAPGKPTRLSALGSLYPQIPADQAAPVKAVNYKSRDGLLIRAYLTLPPGPAPSTPIPFVVLPHGGPKARDTMDFNFIAQMLATRGYGVLQPNFRGSSGYGASFLAIGLQEWGLRMQDDITDGTKWLIDQKLADPQHIGIVGWSYGGYAALMGAIKEPGLYRCVASMAGVSDLKRVFGNQKAQANRVAGPILEGNLTDLAPNSPIEQVARLNVPVLLAHGKLDRTVPVEDTRKLEAALKAAGKTVQAVYYDGDDHSMYLEADRMDFMKRLAAFLRDNLGPGSLAAAR